MSTFDAAKSPIEDGARGAAAAMRPFAGLIDAVLVPEGLTFSFAGAIPYPEAAAAWAWMQRDVLPGPMAAVMAETDAERRSAALDAILPELIVRARDQLATRDNEEGDRRLRVQLGSDDAVAHLPVVLLALKSRALLRKAQDFGRAASSIGDEGALAVAIQSMPLTDSALAALLLNAAMGQIGNPSRFINAAVRIAGSSGEGALQRVGLAPLIDAALSHAQNQIPLLQQSGVFADIDLVCRAVNRFHKLMRAVTGYVELSRLSRWSTVVAGLTKTASEALEPRLREVVPAISRSMRRREGVDRLDSEDTLLALNGCYLVDAVRNARDSLALNAVFDQTWTQLGQALDTYTQRNLEAVRQNPGDRVAAARLDATIKMAQLRFNDEYTENMRRALGTAEKRVS